MVTGLLVPLQEPTHTHLQLQLVPGQACHLSLQGGHAALRLHSLLLLSHELLRQVGDLCGEEILHRVFNGLVGKLLICFHMSS